MTDPARWLASEIAAWRALNKREKRAIRDFPVLWALFEMYATGQRGQRPNATPKRICAAVRALPHPPVLGREVNAARTHFADRYFPNVQPTIAWGHLRVDPNFEPLVRDGLTNPNANSAQVLTALLLVVNRLRNNYLHGEKAQYGFAGQLANFRHANNVLIAAIQIWK